MNIGVDWRGVVAAAVACWPVGGAVAVSAIGGRAVVALADAVGAAPDVKGGVGVDALAQAPSRPIMVQRRIRIAF